MWIITIVSVIVATFAVVALSRVEEKVGTHKHIKHVNTGTQMQALIEQKHTQNTSGYTRNTGTSKNMNS